MPVRGDYDVVILGGGPAGSATALALKQRDAGLRVALMEKTDYAALRIGETLTPTARAPLLELGIWDAFLASSPLASYGTRAAWGSSDFYENEFIFSPYGHGWHVNRREFDALLSTQAECAGVEVILNSSLCARPRREKQWVLTIQRGDSAAHEIGSRFVVDATGRRSWFASCLGVRHRVYDQLAGAFVFFRFDSADAPTDTYTSIEACEHGWWYSAVLPEERMVVGFMTDAAQLRSLPWRRIEEWRSLLVSTPYTAGRIVMATPLGKPVLYPAGSQRLETPAGEDWLAVGDAASTFDPLSSQGIVKALRSGICAANVIQRQLRGETGSFRAYASLFAREFDSYLETRASYYRLEQRWPHSRFWERNQKIIAFDVQRLADVNQPSRTQQESYPRVHCHVASFDDDKALRRDDCKIDNLKEREESWLNQTLQK